MGISDQPSRRFPFSVRSCSGVGSLDKIPGEEARGAPHDHDTLPTQTDDFAAHSGLGGELHAARIMDEFEATRPSVGFSLDLPEQSLKVLMRELRRTQLVIEESAATLTESKTLYLSSSAKGLAELILLSAKEQASILTELSDALATPQSEPM